VPEFETPLPVYVRSRVDADHELSDRAGPDDADLGVEDLDAGDEPEPMREGLPPGFRMRADRHYVETLYAHQDEVRVEHRRGDALLPIVYELSAALHAVGASAADITMRGRSLRERAALALVRAEAQRAAWLADAATALVRDPTCALDLVNLAHVVRRVLVSLEPAQRITGVEPTLYVADAASTVSGDCRLLEAAVGGIVVAMGAIVEERGAQGRLAIRLTPASHDPSLRSLAVTQTSVVVPAYALSRFFDEPWADHPAGRVGALHLAAAQRIARVHRGHLTVAAVESGGCAVTFTLKASG
jgi:C4-dicarboxylate-specific signal transduction histidine kinase